MPGIVGIIRSGPLDENASALSQMVKCMMHETTYTSGTYTNERLGVFVGWVTHEGSFSDCMPVWNETKNICLIFSGEDFTDPDKIALLRSKGHECDLEKSSYLVHLYEEMGLKFIEQLNGWFSGLVIDIRERKIILFNDRYGLGRVYYHENSDGLYFSSEAKSLLKVLPKLRQLDYISLAETFSCGCVLQNRSLFSGISQLPGASMWVFSPNESIRKSTYFRPDCWEKQPTLAAEDYYKKLKNTFVHILPRYFRRSKLVGMSLTGGFDCRMIMAWINHPPGGLPCYSFGSMYRNCMDVNIAQRVARQCGQPHEIITVDSQFFSVFESLAEKTIFVSDGTMDVSGSVELYVNRIASRIAPVRMTGNYGSEIIRGNVAFRPGSVNTELLDVGFARLVQTASDTYTNERRGHKLSFIAFKQVPWHHYSRLSVEQSQLTLRSPYLDNDLVSLMYQAPPDLIMSKEPCFRLIADGNKALGKIPTDRGLLYRPIPLITKFHNFFEEVTFRAEYAYDYGMPQWLARIDHALAPIHPERLFLGRHKFYHFRIWYRDNLYNYLKDILLDSRTLARPYLNSRYIEKIINDHIRGIGNYTSEIHQVLSSELIQRKLIENQ
jgi:asparagine synthase (glutamine-hydrolysing)